MLCTGFLQFFKVNSNPIGQLRGILRIHRYDDLFFPYYPEFSFEFDNIAHTTIFVDLMCNLIWQWRVFRVECNHEFTLWRKTACSTIGLDSS